MRDNTIEISEEEQLRFNLCCQAFQDEARESVGIGTLGEKTLHAVLKRYLEPDTSFHELASHGYVVDILNEDGAIEIQTAGFNRLRRKIDRFLPDLPLRIIYPIPAKKYISWFDPATGEELGRRLSPKRGSRSDALFELYKIRPWLLEPGLRIELYYIDVEEHRLLDGWDKSKKRGSTRVDRLPIALDHIEVLAAPEDYLSYVPRDIVEPFTVKQFAKQGKYTPRDAQTILRMLRDFGLAEVIGKEGRAFLHRLNDQILA